jgi:hypothetical protein
MSESNERTVITSADSGLVRVDANRRSFNPRPEKCCDGAAVGTTSVFGNVNDSHQSSSVIRSACTRRQLHRIRRHNVTGTARSNSPMRAGLGALSLC